MTVNGTVLTEGDPDVLETLQQQIGAVEGVYASEGQMLHFVPDEAAAQQLLLLWQA